MKYDLRILFLLFIIYSLTGWIYEVIVGLVKQKKFIDRGFLLGPYCPVYGFGGILMTLLLSRYIDDKVTLFIMCILLFSVLEYLTSYILEKVFNARWWDYSKFKFNINGRICLEVMIPFGIAGLFFMYIANPFFLEIINKIPQTLLSIITIILLIIFISDIFISFDAMFKIKRTIKKVKKDNTEEITKKVKEIIMQNSYLKKRLIKAFPKLKIK